MNLAEIQYVSDAQGNRVAVIVPMEIWEDLKEENGKQSEKKTVSFLEATQEFAGCLDGGPTDLSTNKKYLEDLGK